MSASHHRTTTVRPAAVAGHFYPAETAELSLMLDNYLSAHDVEVDPPKAVIAPHAGYIYSGPIAANVYAHIAQSNTAITRVVLLGPAHRVYVEGIASVSHTHFATPLGNVAIDNDALDKIAGYPFVTVMDEAHVEEHSLEVHLPFLQKVLDDFTLVPLLIGNADPKQVASLLDTLWGGKETLIVISSDLSHYLDYETACRTDAETTRLIEALDYPHIDPEQACGCMPIRGLLKLAEKKNMTVKTLDVRNSGDTAGTKDRVVGYGAYALFEG